MPVSLVLGRAAGPASALMLWGPVQDVCDEHLGGDFVPAPHRGLRVPVLLE